MKDVGTMQIYVGSAIGSAPTKMAAFDAALNSIGIANYNMLRLSSVVPPNSEIITSDGRIAYDLPGNWGDRLYVVMAETRVDEPGQEAWAGIGWVQDPETGKGLFTEHEGSSEAFVRREIEQSLKAFMTTRQVDFGEIHSVVIGATCEKEPICAMTAAAFQVSDWQNKSYLLGE